MAFPPLVEFCHVRDRLILKWYQVYYRETQHTGNTVLSRDQALQMAYKIIAACNEFPEADEATGLVMPVKADHLPPVPPVPLDVLMEDVQVGTVEEKVAGLHTMGSGH